MRHTVYKTTNTLNGKFYVGIHRTQKPNDRYLGSGKLITAAIQKYGRDAFAKEVLFDFDTEEEMIAKEEEIVTVEFVERVDTYNLVPGGYQGDSFYQAIRALSPERRVARARIGNRGMRAKYDADPEFKARMDAIATQNILQAPPSPDWSGRTHTEETRTKMAAAARKRTGWKNSQYGTAWVCRDGGKPRKVPKADVPRFLEVGWERGRKLKRSPTPRRSRRGTGSGARLTAHQVKEIRERYAAGDSTQSSLASEYGVTQKTVSKIVNHKSW